MKKTQTILVTGASGHLGHRAVELLLAADAGTVIAGSRKPEMLADLAAKGAHTCAVDFERPETMAKAFAGVDRVLIVSTDALDRPGRRLAQHKAAIDAAVAAGVKHVVYTSSANAVAGSAILVNPDHQHTEDALTAAPIGHTILRNNYYADNLLASLPPTLESGRWHATAGAGDGRAAYVTREDCARVATAALAADFTGKRTLDVSGPELLSHVDVAKITSEVAGRPLAYISVDEASLVAGMVQAGLPEPIARVLASFDIGIAKGELAIQSSTVADLTGKPATTLREFFTAHRAILAG